MGTSTNSKRANEQWAPNLARILEEGYGAGAWHGPDLKAALADVSPEIAFWRPSAGRHNIAEIALHHAYYARSVRERLSGAPPEPFVLQGDDWFSVPGKTSLGWPEIQGVVEEQQRRLATLVADIDANQVKPALPASESLGLVLGITCHAVYHAGQAQLIKRLHVG
ncbi:MAG TPA: DinB family protein [Terriglobia bacterium]|nr:DinB family protein [Terriglobia bacterium]